MSGWVPCPTAGCRGDGRYAAPGRGHLVTCHYPQGLDPAVGMALECARADERAQVIAYLSDTAYRIRLTHPPLPGRAATLEEAASLLRTMAEEESADDV